jgi:hypothetical protein
MPGEKHVPRYYHNIQLISTLKLPRVVEMR